MNNFSRGPIDLEGLNHNDFDNHLAKVMGSYTIDMVHGCQKERKIQYPFKPRYRTIISLFFSSHNKLPGRHIGPN